MPVVNHSTLNMSAQIILDNWQITMHCVGAFQVFLYVDFEQISVQKSTFYKLTEGQLL